MSDASDENNLTPAPPDAGDLIAQALESLLDLGIPKMPEAPKLSAGIRLLARDLLIQLDPQDAAERMLAVQMIAAFSRGMFLARYANLQKNHRWFRLYSGECDRAMAMFRRQMQTFSDLRRPRRTTFTAIRNANFAGQQIVVTEPLESITQPPGRSQSAFVAATPASGVGFPTENGDAGVAATNPPNAIPVPQQTVRDGQPIQEAQAALPSQPSRPRRIARQRQKKPPLGT